MSADLTVTGPEWLRGELGPPQPIGEFELLGWEDRALDWEQEFEADLGALGLSDREVAAGVRARDEAASYVDQQVSAFWAAHPRRYARTPPEVQEEVELIYNSAQLRARDKLRDFFERRTIEVEDRAQTTVQIPLFTLGAADRPNCTAEFKRAASEQRSAGGSLLVSGTGVGASAVTTISAAWTFRAASGETKVIVVTVLVTVERVTVLKKGKVIGRGHRIDLADLDKTKVEAAPLLLAPDARPPIGAELRTYPLAGDPSGAIATYEYSYVQNKTAQLELGLKFQGVELGLNSAVTFERSLTLTYDLAGGSDYALHGMAEGDGAIWRT